MQRKNINNRIRLGVFVTLAITLFIVGIYFIGSHQHLFSSTFQISAIFNDVNGLQVGNNVRFSGINVGTIRNISIINDTSVKVEMVINRSTQKFIKKDVKAIIGSEGLIGNKVLIIIPGNSQSEPINNNDTIQTITPVNLDDIFLNLKLTTDNASMITNDLAAIMGGIRAGKGTIGKIFIDSSFAMNIDQTIVNLKRSSKGLNENMEAAKHNFLLKGYFNKKEKEAQKKEKQIQKTKQEDDGTKSEKKSVFNGLFSKKEKHDINSADKK